MIKKILLAISLIAMRAQAAEENLPHNVQYSQQNGTITVDCRKCPTNQPDRIKKFFLTYNSNSYYVKNIPANYTALALKRIIMQGSNEIDSYYLTASPEDCSFDIPLGDDRTLGSLKMEGSRHFYIADNEEIDLRDQLKCEQWQKQRKKKEIEEYYLSKNSKTPTKEEVEVLGRMRDNWYNNNEFKNLKIIMDTHKAEQAERAEQDAEDDYICEILNGETVIPEKATAPSEDPLPICYSFDDYRY